MPPRRATRVRPLSRRPAPTPRSRSIRPGRPARRWSIGAGSVRAGIGLSSRPDYAPCHVSQLTGSEKPARGWCSRRFRARRTAGRCPMTSRSRPSWSGTRRSAGVRPGWTGRVPSPAGLQGLPAQAVDQQHDDALGRPVRRVRLALHPQRRQCRRQHVGQAACPYRIISAGGRAVMPTVGPPTQPVATAATAWQLERRTRYGATTIRRRAQRSRRPTPSPATRRDRPGCACPDRWS